jgi:hypothetical protein
VYWRWQMEEQLTSVLDDTIIQDNPSGLITRIEPHLTNGYMLS